MTNTDNQPISEAEYIAVITALIRSARGARDRVDAFRRASTGQETAISAYLINPTDNNLQELNRTRVTLARLRELKGYDDEK